MVRYIKIYERYMKDFMTENDYDVSSIDLGKALLNYYFNKYGEEYIIDNGRKALYSDDTMNEFDEEIKTNKYGMSHDFKKIKDEYMHDKDAKENMFDDYESFISNLK